MKMKHFVKKIAAEHAQIGAKLETQRALFESSSEKDLAAVGQFVEYKNTKIFEIFKKCLCIFDNIKSNKNEFHLFMVLN